MDTYEYRTAEADDWHNIMLLQSEGFNEEISDEWSAMSRLVFEPERTFLATTPSGDVAGVSSAYSRGLTTPGGTVPAAHVSLVSVDSMHRRRGILRDMICLLHDDALSRGEPVAVLCASEGRIYQRFGYGQAAFRLTMDIDTREVSLLPIGASGGGGAIRKGALPDVDPLVRVFDRARQERPGWSTRDERWWARVTTDLKEERHGATALRVALHENVDGVDGYMLWQVKPEPGATPGGKVIVREMVAANVEAYRALWGYAFSIDLTRRVTTSFAAIDEPLMHLVNEPRALESKLSDALWARILSVPGALQARRYAMPVDVVIDIEDRAIAGNNARWHLVGGGDHARCVRTDAAADLRLDIAALGAVYLGGGSLAALAAGGRVHELTRGSLAAASAAFGWHRSPSALEDF
jgi:predicted acetyltransferase